MTKEDVIRLAREAGFLYGVMGPSNTRFVTAIGNTFTVELEAFAKLVAEHEREACAKVCEFNARMNISSTGIADAIRARGQA